MKVMPDKLTMEVLLPLPLKLRAVPNPELHETTAPLPCRLMSEPVKLTCCMSGKTDPEENFSSIAAEAC